MIPPVDGAQGRVSPAERTPATIAVEILENMSDAFVAIDREWHYIYVNRAAERIVNRRRDEMLGRTVWELFPQEGTQFERACHRAMHERVTVHFDEYYAPLDTWFENTVYPAENGITIYTRDITERKRSEEALREESERRVAERTTELWAMNVQLKLEIVERERAEAAVRVAKEDAERRAHEAEEAQSILHAILEHAPEGITMIGGAPDYRLIANSRRAESMLGRREPRTILNILPRLGAEAGGVPISDDVTQGNPEDLPLYGATRDGRVVENHECTIERPDGSRLDVLVNVAPVRDFHGRIIGAINCWRDVTERNAAEVERKRAEELLHEANRRVELILDSITDNFFGISKDWRFTYLNTHAAAQMRVLGKDPKRLIGKVLWDEFEYVPNEAALRRVMSERVAITDELYYPPLAAWLENHTYPSPDGGIVTFQKDITERKWAEEELRRSEGYLVAAESLSHMGSWAYVVSTGKLFWSHEHCRIFGVDPETFEPTIASTRQLIHPDDRAAAIEVFEKAVQEKRPFEWDVRVARPDGAVRFVHSVAHPVFDKSGALAEFVGTIVDVTEQKRVDEERTRLIRHAMAAHEDERRRIAREMHDQLGERLSALAINIAALREECGPAQAKHLDGLERITRQLDADLSFLVWELRPTALDDLGLVVALTTYVKSWAKHFGIDAQVHVDGLDKDRLPAEAETTLYRITQEGLTNVAKHAKANHVAVILNRRRDHISLIVEDDGVGFDAARVFGEGEKRWGLVGMRERAELLGGSLDFESTPGRGMTIAARLPLPPVSAREQHDA